jgi:hypothetical protein
MPHVEGDFDPTKFGFPPPLTRKQGLARWAADHEIQRKYPLQYVAYLDVWDGEELDRRVLAATTTREECEAKLGGLDPETRGKVEITYVDDPNQIFAS